MKRALIVRSFVFALFVGAGIAGGICGVPMAKSREQGPKLRSKIIYPPQKIAIKMNHRHEGHRNVPCTDCHSAAPSSLRASDVLIPEPNACNSCHQKEVGQGHNPEIPLATRDSYHSEEGQCSFCHLPQAESRRVMRSSFPTARLKFSHKLHVEQGASCLSCHNVNNRTLATTQDLPEMESCFSCHVTNPNKKEGQADQQCSTCHLKQGSTKLRTEFSNGRLLPPMWMGDLGHDRDFLVRHRWLAADNAADCITCHTENECEDCHSGRMTPTKIHPGDYLSSHPADARRNQPQCTSCHSVDRFCQGCHSRLGFSNLGPAVLSSASRFHPPQELWESAHGREARRAMIQCSSCHLERDCTSCHGALGIGGGISPHPAGFRNRCKAIASENARACNLCHGRTPEECR